MSLRGINASCPGGSDFVNTKPISYPSGNNWIVTQGSVTLKYHRRILCTFSWTQALYRRNDLHHINQTGTTIMWVAPGSMLHRCSFNTMQFTGLKGSMSCSLACLGPWSQLVYLEKGWDFREIRRLPFLVCSSMVCQVRNKVTLIQKPDDAKIQCKNRDRGPGSYSSSIILVAIILNQRKSANRFTRNYQYHEASGWAEAIISDDQSVACE